MAYSIETEYARGVTKSLASGTAVDVGTPNIDVMVSHIVISSDDADDATLVFRSTDNAIEYLEIEIYAADRVLVIPGFRAPTGLEFIRTAGTGDPIVSVFFFQP